MPTLPNITPVEGTTFGYCTTQTGTYTVLGDEVQEIQLPDLEQAKVETWGLTSTVKVSRPSKILGLGDAKVSFYADPAFTAHTTLETDAANQSVLWWQITLPLVAAQTTHSNYKFSGYMTKLTKTDLKGEANHEWSLDIVPTCLPIFTAGT
jgi:hypothetical protein